MGLHVSLSAVSYIQQGFPPRHDQYCVYSRPLSEMSCLSCYWCSHISFLEPRRL